ncbi:MAG: T9SS C-terminal target domain-containing protein [Chitinophagia bacterium]|nr:T9SS C-terminal target domain-containing protein [Chitinophagia bacterium]
MKKLTLLFLLFAVRSQAQITITHADMPVSGDTLRWSSASPMASTIDLNDTGTSRTWDFTSLVPTAQGVDAYKSALSVSPFYALISLQAYGYKVSDSFPGASALPVSITELYTFFEKKSSNTKFSAVAFAAKIAGVPTPFNYTIDDDWFHFPLTYLRYDSSAYLLNISLASVGSIRQKGNRFTRVDAWGTIKTPYRPSPVNCIRVRSEVIGADSINFSGFPFNIPRHTIEYKWLANGEHYPLLWITTNVTGTTERIATIRYRDSVRYIPTGIEEPTATSSPFVAPLYPNPVSANGSIHIKVPENFDNAYTVTLIDRLGKAVITTHNQSDINVSALVAGVYMVSITDGAHIAYNVFEKQ